jgi:hypothetical protein
MVHEHCTRAQLSETKACEYEQTRRVQDSEPSVATLDIHRWRMILPRGTL